MNNLEVKLSDDFELSITGPKGKERIKIVGEYPNNSLSKLIFSQLGLMHLIAPYLPKQISANFRLLPQTKKLISAMYQSESNKPPIFKTPEKQFHFVGETTKAKANKVAVAYSAGKDSMWNMWWTQEKYHPENVLAVHINGLNRSNAPRERQYAKRQARKLGFKNFRIINLLNSSRNRGYQVMRSRDMFLAGIIIPHATEFGASKIITEGFAETSPEEPFTGQPRHMRYFNSILKDLKIPVQMRWRNRKEMDVVKDLLNYRPDWLPHVCNCFAAPCYQPYLRRSWQKRAPTFPLYDSQCGSCVKCRIINLARVLYDPAMRKVKKDDIETFLKNTSAWIRINRVRLADMIEGSFLQDFKKALAKYEIEPK